MAYVEGANVSTMLYRQIQSIGNAREGLRQAIKKIAHGSGKRGFRLSGSEAATVCRKAGVRTVQPMFGLPYGDDEFNVFYYRTGSTEHADALLEKKRDQVSRRQRQRASVVPAGRPV